MKKVKIIASVPMGGQDELHEHIGKEYEVLDSSKYVDGYVLKESLKLEEVFVFLEEMDKHPSILNKGEYKYI